MSNREGGNIPEPWLIFCIIQINGVKTQVFKNDMRVISVKIIKKSWSHLNLNHGVGLSAGLAESAPGQ